jgi:hypothetical protein
MSRILAMPAEVEVPSQTEPGKKRRNVAPLPLPTRRLLKLREGASYLSVSDKALRKMIVSGELAVIKNGDAAERAVAGRHERLGSMDRPQQTNAVLKCREGGRLVSRENPSFVATFHVPVTTSMRQR